MILGLSKLNSAQTLLCKCKRNVTECKSSGLIYGPRMSELPNFEHVGAHSSQPFDSGIFQSSLSTLIHHRDSGSSTQNSSQPLCQKMQGRMTEQAIQVVHPADIWRGLLTVVQHLSTMHRRIESHCIAVTTEQRGWSQGVQLETGNDRCSADALKCLLVWAHIRQQKQTHKLCRRVVYSDQTLHSEEFSLSDEAKSLSQQFNWYLITQNAEQTLVSVNVHIIMEKSRQWFLLTMPLFLLRKF